MPVFSSYFFCFSNAVEAILYGVDLIGLHMRSYSLARLGVILSPVIALIISSFNHFFSFRFHSCLQRTTVLLTLRLPYSESLFFP